MKDFRDIFGLFILNFYFPYIFNIISKRLAIYGCCHLKIAFLYGSKNPFFDL